MHEIRRNVRPPGIERILRCMIVCWPITLSRNVVDVSGVFRETSPRILHVMEVVGAKHMTAKAPTLRKAFLEHMHGTLTNFVHGAYVPAKMVMSRGIRAREGDHMMITTVDPMQERDIVP